MRHALLPLALVAMITACSGGSGGEAAQAVTRDSAGIAIVEHSAESWEAAPTWALSAEPLAVVGGESDDGSIDLTNSQVGSMTSDGRVLAATMQPAQIYQFSTDGSTPTLLGRGGEGPGEYQFVMSLFPLGGDTVAAYDLMKRRVVMFNGAGEPLEPIAFPMNGAPIPPMLMGRLNDGTWMFQAFNPLAEPPEGTTDVYRLDSPVLTWRNGAETYDTAFSLLGPMLKPGTVSMGVESMSMGRGIGFGANSFVGGSVETIWSTTGDRFVISGHDATGALKREIRVGLPIRPVVEADRERLKNAIREQFERIASMVPPAFLESELAKIDETPFAENHAAIGQMLVDRTGRVWATPNLPMVDTTVTWGVFDAEGALLGKVVVPAGTLYAASQDRVVIRREDDETGLVRLEVWGVQREP